MASLPTFGNPFRIVSPHNRAPEPSTYKI